MLLMSQYVRVCITACVCIHMYLHASASDREGACAALCKPGSWFRRDEKCEPHCQLLIKYFLISAKYIRFMHVCIHECAVYDVFTINIIYKEEICLNHDE